MPLTPTEMTDRAAWNAAAERFPAAHILQSWEWGEFKHLTTGWKPLRLAFARDGETVALASIGVRQAGPLKVMYAPKAPLMDYADLDLSAEVLDALESVAKRERAVTLKIDPDIPLKLGAPDDEGGERPDPRGTAWQNLLARRGWVYSREQIQFRNTIVIDLTPDEDALLMRLSQNTRRKVRVAERAGVTIRAATGADLPILVQLYQETGRRDGFLTRPQAYYERAWRDFMLAGRCHALIAEAGGVEIAHVVLYQFGQTCWYFYGASRDLHRDKMPNYLLQWEAMRWAKAQGCTRYDLWGAPDVFDESDRLWGVYQFKRGFRGTVQQYIGAYDYAPNKLLYRAFSELLPRIRSLVRRAKHGRSDHAD
ncbi:MAG: peptidoglycan bridge formation glycyltransferase FemA/FemB family protein [Chloroflexi bacterium]|nr:peptidoglycan bridge formation glycyltransferase FemA/FemB family protein [Chloroflexota bacterium]